MKCTTRYAIVKEENSEGMISKVPYHIHEPNLLNQELPIFLIIVGLFLFIMIYGITKYLAAKRLHNQYERMSDTLSLYVEVWGTIADATSEATYEQLHLEKNKILIALHKCKTSPHIKPNLQGQIELYIQESSQTRLYMVKQALEDEIEVLRKKRQNLLKQIESPSFGQLLWQTTAPVIPCLFAIILFFDLNVLLLLVLNTTWMHLDSIEFEAWLSWIGLNIAIFVAYPLFTARFRKLRQILLALLISGLGVLGTIIAFTSPYVVGLQIILIMIGLSMTGEKLRRKRPFAGMTQVRELEENPKPSPHRDVHPSPSSNNSEQE
ncbi:hypothetical protein ABE099_13430 [Paenibacillus turicensis]|uniref:hypothetical protein n=1 Tax=Paenibacillus turicensis TaxID=160487 RepID=UPI003D274B7F